MQHSRNDDEFVTCIKQTLHQTRSLRQERPAACNRTAPGVCVRLLPSHIRARDGPQVRALFTVAACVPPAVIFIDEIDSILSARKAEGANL